MKKTHIKAYNALKKLGVPVYVHGDYEQGFDIDGEHPDSYLWLDYYDRPEWAFGINPKIDEILTKHGLFAEWVNPAHARVYLA